MSTSARGRNLCAYSGEQDKYFSFSGTELIYQKIRYIDQGGNGKIFLAEGAVFEAEDDEWRGAQLRDVLLAVKEVAVYTSDASQLSRESFEFLQGLRHPNILRCYGLDMRELTNRSAHHSPVLKLVTEYCYGGDIARRMSMETLTTSQINHFLHQALSGLSFLHEKRIIHADIKCGNLFLKDDTIYPVLKIGDLDDPVRMTHSETATTDKSNFYGKGTRGHQSPEQLSMDVKVGRRTDVWSLGVAVIEMIRAKAPNFWFIIPGTQRRLEVVSSTTAKPIEFFVFDGGVPEIPLETDSDLREVLMRCFERNPAARSTSAALLQFCRSRNLSRSWDVPKSSAVEFVKGPLTELEVSKITATGCYSETPQVSWLDNSAPMVSGDAGNREQESLHPDLLTFVITEEHSLLYCMLLVHQANVRRPLHIVVKGPRNLVDNQFEPAHKHVVALSLVGFTGTLDFRELSVKYVRLKNLQIISIESPLLQDTILTQIELSDDYRSLRKLRAVLLHNVVIKKISGGFLDTLRGLDSINLNLNSKVHNRFNDGESFQTCLKELVYEDSFAELRQLLSEKPSLTTTREAGALLKYGNCQSKAFPEDANFLAKIRHGSLFKDGALPPEIQFQLDGSTELLVHGCCTARMIVDPENDVDAFQRVVCTQTGETTDATDISTFCERLFRLREGQPVYRKPISLTILRKPLSFAVSFGNLAGSIFHLAISNWDATSSRDVARFDLPNLQVLLYADCGDVMLNCGHLTKFKDLRSVILYNCTTVMIQENLFAELEKLDQLTLDTPYYLPEHRTVGSNGNSHMKRFHFSPGYKWLRDYLSQRPSLVEAKPKKVVPFGDGFYVTAERTEQENFMINIKEEDLSIVKI